MNREKWAELLPVIQAFVDGKPVQRRWYDKRWKDVDYLCDLLNTEHRIRPELMTSGTWEQDFQYTEQGKISGPVLTGVMRWDGTDNDTPDWPTWNGMTLIGLARFVKAT